MRDLDVIDRPDAAAAALDPLRAQVLDALAEPGSASSVAARLGLPRQKVNYHLRALEALGLVELVAERPRRGFTERVVAASARSYVLSSALLGAGAPDPDRIDRLSARHLVALAARVVAEVGDLVRRADEVDKSLPTLSIDAEVCFASADDRAAFTAELGDAISALVARHHAPTAPGGRWHRVMVGAHPHPHPPTEDPHDR